MDKPIISIVIPAYNAEKYIEETLKSVSEQTYASWECIIVNDGSTDNTISVVESFIQKDKNKQKFIFYSKENEGHSKTRNYGIDHSNGEYIAFLDSDDVWMPHHLESLIDTIHQHKVDCIVSKCYVIRNGKYTEEPVQHYKSLRGVQNPKDFISNILFSNEISTPALLCKKQKILEVGKFSYGKNAEDFHLWMKLAFSNCIFYFYEDFTVYVRILHTSASNQDRNCTKEMVEVISIFKQQIKEYGIDYEYFFNLWARRYFLIKDTKEHYIEAIKYINSIEEEKLTILKIIAPLLPKKILKLLVLKSLSI